MRVLSHIKKLDDCFGQFLVRVICDCGACREIEPEALARLVGWSITLKALVPRMRCSKCGKKAAEVMAVARPRPRGSTEEPALNNSQVAIAWLLAKSHAMLPIPGTGSVEHLEENIAVARLQLTPAEAQRARLAAPISAGCGTPTRAAHG